MSSVDDDRLTPTAKRIQLYCVWAAPIGMVVFLIGFWGFARMFPPMSPNWSAERLALFFHRHRDGVLIGQLIVLLGSGLFFPFWAVISAQMARIERGRFPILAMVQFGCGVSNEIFFVLYSILWILAAFRTNVPATTIQSFNDMAWIMWALVFPHYCLQMITIAATAFIDHSSHPVWPRWFGYFSIAVGVTGPMGILAGIYKTGPFAWNGIVGFYPAIVAYFIWLVIMTYLLIKGIERQALDSSSIVPQESVAESFRRVDIPVV